MADQDYATVSGTKAHKSDFAYAPEGSEPSEWKLPIHDASHVRNALARFNQTELPADAKAAAHAKIMRAAKKFGIDAGKVAGSRFQVSGNESDTSHLTPDTCIAVLMTNEGVAVETPEGMATQRPGAQLREIAVAVLGAWVKGDHSFSISSEDLADMVRNFAKRKNDMIVIDYEHASEQPEVAKGGPIPGAGWIHGLSANGNLTALVEWTPQAEEMLRTGQYRFFSPAIDWGARDKETGEPQGATLTSGALTNHPFLEELPPIMLSDGTVITAGARSQVWGSGRPDTRKGALKMAEEKEKKEKLEDPEEKLDDAGDGGSGTMSDLPKLKIRAGRKGSKHEGHHILSDDSGDVGYMSTEDLAAHAKKHLGVNPDREEDKQMAAEKTNALILSELAKEGR
ncbi:MAG: phage protease, partial [Terriglobia bacterium]